MAIGELKQIEQMADDIVDIQTRNVGNSSYSGDSNEDIIIHNVNDFESIALLISRLAGKMIEWVKIQRPNFHKNQTL